MNPTTANTSKVTRIEVIDQKGRRFVTHSAENVALSLQDDGRTMKVFYREVKNDG